MKVMVSVHDVSPAFYKELELILKALEGVKKHFLVTPNWNGCYLINKDLAQMLKGEKLVLHGLTHQTSKRDYFGRLLLLSSNSFKEFYHLNESETREKIMRGTTIFEEVFDRHPVGFVPPMWYHNRHSILILKELGFSYTESETAFIKLNGINISGIPACFDFGNNKLLNYLSLYSWKYFLINFRQPLLRFSIHSADARNGLLPHIAEMLERMKEKNYMFLDYEDLLKDSCFPSSSVH